MFVRPSPGFSKPRAEQAVDRALTFARRAGLVAERGEVISEGTNVLVRLKPEPALARSRTGAICCGRTVPGRGRRGR
jgi:hypothetical protein